ncbi:MAG: type II secretion system F family protein, partial [Desulfamplus sp.]|nr:type II secretion system F family protein [Desulfamplus sp.]
KCTITTSDGYALSKTIVADSVSAVKERVAQEGNFLVEARRSAGDSSFFSFSSFKTLKPKKFISFNHEFSVLLRSGMPIVTALDTLIHNESNQRFQSLLNEIRTDISNGESLSSAFSKHEHIFSPMYAAALKAGESNGTVPQSIFKYIEYLKRAQSIKQKIKAASIYPAILTIASLFVVTFLLIFVVPAITSSFSDSGTELPFITQMLLTASGFIKHKFLWIGFTLLSCWILFRMFQKSEDGKKILHKMVLHLPYTGNLVKAYAVSRFTSTLSSLLASGFTLNSAITTSAGLISNQHIKSLIMDVVDEVEKGESFSAGLKKSGVFPDLAVSMIVAGEQSGSLEEILMELAQLYENDVENGLTAMTSMIEPVLMIMMGFIIGFIVLALYMPIFQMAGTI